VTAPLIGVIADDCTGAADVASLLAEQGLAVTVRFGHEPVDVPERPDAIVVGLKTRTAPVAEAVARSVAVADQLTRAGVGRLYFKYCSTFDSTDEGNIGPVADALADLHGVEGVVICPAYPAQGRTVEDGELRVHGIPLAQTAMGSHPLTPMTDSNVVRLLARQTPNLVGSIPRTTVAAGADALAVELDRQARARTRHVVVDAVTDAEIGSIAAAVRDAPLVTGGAALAAAIAAAARPEGEVAAAGARERPLAPSHDGSAVVLAGSCSEATRAQVAEMLGWAPGYRIPALPGEPGDVPDIDGIAAWAAPRLSNGPVLIHSCTDPTDVAEAQRRVGRAAASAAVESIFAETAVRLVEAGVRRLVIAGGETSGAVVEALPPSAYRVGRTIEPGVPWLHSTRDPGLALALKSGNFGSPDFFRAALDAAA
jgi:uncharacterized protein YgbK (DUF1537 family)